MEFAVGHAGDGRLSVADSPGGLEWVDNVGFGEAKGHGIDNGVELDDNEAF